MNPSDFLTLIDDTFNEMKRLTATKGAEYKGSGGGQFDNFVRYSSRAGLTVGQAWLVLFAKHLDAIDTFIRDDSQKVGRVRSEPINGRIDDAILYLVLLKGMVSTGLVGTVPAKALDRQSHMQHPLEFPPVYVGQLVESFGDDTTTPNRLADFNPPPGLVRLPASAVGMPYVASAVDSGVPRAIEILAGMVGDHVGRGVLSVNNPAAVYVMGDDEAVARGLCRYLGISTSAVISSAAFVPRDKSSGIVVYAMTSKVGGDPFSPELKSVGGWLYSIPAAHLEAEKAALDKGHVFVAIAMAESDTPKNDTICGAYTVVASMIVLGE